MSTLLIPERRHDLGGGFAVGRVLPYRLRRMVGPFVFFDHIGPLDMPVGLPREWDVRPHPHIGLATITYLFDGELMHRDSLACEQTIRPGEVNWMTAGRGITHSERFEALRAHGGLMHGIQAWVGLPEADEECEPSFTHVATADLPTVQENGMQLRLIAGRAFGLGSPVRTQSPLFYLHWELQPGTEVELPAAVASERAVHVAAGAVSVDGQPLHAGEMLVLGEGDVRIRATGPAIVMALGGEPIGPRYIHWNFVSSSRERIEQARADWAAGRMKLPDADNAEWIPLPERPAVPTRPAS